MSKSIGTPNFDKIAQSTAELLLLPVCENGRPPDSNSISGFNFDMFIVTGKAFCIDMPHFIQISQPTADL